MGAQQQQQDDDDQDAPKQDEGKPDGAEDEQEGIEMQQHFDGTLDDVQKDNPAFDQEVYFSGNCGIGILPLQYCACDHLSVSWCRMRSLR